MRRRQRPQLQIRHHYMRINGEKVRIDPMKTDLPDRCKKVWAEAILGCKCELVERVAP